MKIKIFYIAVTSLIVTKADDSSAETVPWLRRLGASRSPWRRGFDCRRVHVRFMVDTVALEDIFLQELQFSSVGLIPPTLHTCSLIYHRHQFSVCLYYRTVGSFLILPELLVIHETQP
jgi:hypothetical protein